MILIYFDYIRDWDGELFVYFKENVGGEIVICLFYLIDIFLNFCVVMSILLRDG